MQLTTNAYIKSMNILFIALAAGQTLFAVIACVLQSNGLFSASTDLVPVFTYLVPILCLTLIFASQFIFKKRLIAIDESNSLKDKLNAYRAVYITRWAMIEGAVLFTVIAYLLTGAQMLLIIMVLMIVVFLTLSPSINRTLKELSLSSEEQDVLNDPNGIID